MHHYKGMENIKFFIFSDESPMEYVPLGTNIQFIRQTHLSWLDATNSKFQNILDLANNLQGIDYVYYFDADTEISKDFTEDWFLGELVGGEHFGNRGWLQGCVGYDKNPRSQAYVPPDTPLPCMYYYGAFFGGRTSRVQEFCSILRQYQLEDRKIQYEPGCNDESYINHYFHYHPPTLVVPTEKFMFVISDKGGLQGIRHPDMDIQYYKDEMKKHPDTPFNIRNCLIEWI
jgi:hypothetical protein